MIMRTGRRLMRLLSRTVGSTMLPDSTNQWGNQHANTVTHRQIHSGGIKGLSCVGRCLPDHRVPSLVPVISHIAVRNSECSLQSALNAASIWDRVSKFRDQGNGGVERRDAEREREIWTVRSRGSTRGGPPTLRWVGLIQAVKTESVTNPSDQGIYLKELLHTTEGNKGVIFKDCFHKAESFEILKLHETSLCFSQQFFFKNCSGNDLTYVSNYCLLHNLTWCLCSSNLSIKQHINIAEKMPAADFHVYLHKNEHLKSGKSTHDDKLKHITNT